MPVEIRVPQLGESVVEATILRWLKNEGDPVSAGETIVELETDKINVEVPAEQSGVLQKIEHAAGDTVSVGDVIATLGEGALAPAAVTAEIPAAQASPNGRAADVAVPAETNGVAVAPLARKVADENNVDLRQVQGTGPGGRITKDDVTAAVQAGGSTQPAQAPSTPAKIIPSNIAPVPPAASAAAPVATRPDEERVKMTRRRQTIATRLVEAQHSAAMLTTFNEVDMTAIMEIRARRKDTFKEKNGVGLGFMSFFTKASVGALRSFPYLNAEIQGTDIVLKRYYDIGIAVSTEEGLVVPVLRGADKLTFAGIEKGIGSLAVKARENKLSLPDLQGGTFTITNGGVFGSLLSTPILNAPQVAILGMHKIEQRAVVLKGEIVARPMMYLALSYDHRIVDGSEAVRFLVKIKELLEDPETLLLEG